MFYDSAPGATVHTIGNGLVAGSGPRMRRAIILDGNHFELSEAGALEEKHFSAAVFPTSQAVASLSRHREAYTVPGSNLPHHSLCGRTGTLSLASPENAVGCASCATKRLYLAP